MGFRVCPVCHTVYPERTPVCPADGSALAPPAGHTSGHERAPAHHTPITPLRLLTPVDGSPHLAYTQTTPLEAAFEPNGKLGGERESTQADERTRTEVQAATQPPRLAESPSVTGSARTSSPSAGGPRSRPSATGRSSVEVPHRAMVVPRDEGPDPMLGHTLGNYRLLAVIGRGGMGHVYRAEHVKLGRQVALKLLRPEYAMRHDAVSRFFQEARAVNRIRHRNIVDINDFVELPEGRTFIIMELLEGSSLGTIQRRVGLLPRERAAHVLLQVCDALEAVHREGIVHRDLKPDNIFVISDPAELDGVRLLDFGVAKLLTYAPGEEVGWQTAAGSVVGTPAYMSPEQAGGVPVDHRSDIYSLGAIMYELFTGHPLFRATSFGEYVLKHLSDAPIPPRSLPKGQEISRRLEAVILRCLAKMPDQRYQNVGELRLELLAALQGLATEQDEHFADEVTDLEPITAANHGRVATDPMSSPFSHPGETLLEAPLGSGGAPGASSAVTGARWAPKTVALTSAIVLALAATASALWGLWGTPTQSAGDETPAAQRLPSPPAIKVAAPSTKGVTLHELPRRDLAEAQRTSPPQVTITIDSTPRGAIVVAEDRPDVVLGRTPWTSTFESDDGTHGFVVSAPGFVEEHTSVRFDRDGTVSLPLKPVTGATPAAVEGRPRAPATKGNGGSAGYRKSTKKRPSWGGAGGGDRRPGASRETLDPFAD